MLDQGDAKYRLPKGTMPSIVSRRGRYVRTLRFASSSLRDDAGPLIRVICEICGKKNTPLFLKYYLIPHRTLRGIILRRLNGEALLILRPAYLFSASKKFDSCNLTVAGLFRK